MTTSHRRRLAASALLAAALPLPLAAQSPHDSLSTGPGTSAPAWSVGSSRAVIDSAEIATAAASTLTELLQTRAAGVSVLMTGGTLRASGTVRVRGLSGFGDRVPLLVVDGVRVDAAQEETYGSASRLDDVALADVARIEILRGPAAAALYGAGAAPGVIVVTTKRGDGAWRWRVRGESAVRSDATSYPTNYHRTGTLTATGAPTADCSLPRVGDGTCTPTGLERWNPLEQASPFRSGAELGAGAELSGGGASTRARLSIDSRRADGIVRDDEASRIGARLALTRELPFGIAASVTGALGRDWSMQSRAGDVVAYGLTRMASPDSAARFRQHVDSLLMGDIPRDRLDRSMLGIGLRWQARPWLAATVQAARDRLDVRSEQFMTGPFEGYHTTGSAWRTLGSFRAALEARHRPILGAAGSATLGTERLRGELFQGQWLSSTTGAVAWQTFHGLSHNDAWFGDERLAWGERAAIGIGARYELDDAVNERWHLHPAIDGSMLLARSLGGAKVRARAAYGEVAQRGQPMFFYYPKLDAEIERVRETEAGIDAEWGTRAALSLTGWQSVTHDAQYLLVTYVGTPIFFHGRLRNRGLDLDGRVRAVQWSHGWWELRGVVSTLSNEVTSFSNGGIVLGDGRAVKKGEPAFAPGDRSYTWSDADGDGIVDRTEVVPGNTVDVRGSPLPTLEAALHSTLAFGDRLTLGVVVDRHSGFWVASTARLRCSLGSCQASQDPATALEDQAEAVAQRYYGGAAMEDASFTRLRELWVRWRIPPRVAARLGAHDASVMLGARNLALWSGASALDPETTAAPREQVLRDPSGAAPLPRELMLKLDIGYGGGR